MNVLTNRRACVTLAIIVIVLSIFCLKTSPVLAQEQHKPQQSQQAKQKQQAKSDWRYFGW